MARHLSIVVVMAAAMLIILSLMGPFRHRSASSAATWSASDGSDTQANPATSKMEGLAVTDNVLLGGAIAPKLENATIKAELGRAAWKVLHTMMARFPDKPTDDDSLALKTYIQLFARLYPCGDCAAHFQKLLKKYPPQTTSRNAAAGWACFVHNEVNKRLKKTLFNCNNIGDFYDCGCGDGDKDKDKDKAKVDGEKAKAGELKKDSLST